MPIDIFIDISDKMVSDDHGSQIRVPQVGVLPIVIIRLNDTCCDINTGE